MLGAVAVKLGETLVKCACEAITGQKILGDMAGGLSAVLGGRAVDGLDSRRARRQLDEIADSVAERVLNQYGREFRRLSSDQRAVVIEAVSETFGLVPPAAGLVLGTGFEVAGLEHKVRSLTSEYRRTRSRSPTRACIHPTAAAASDAHSRVLRPRDETGALCVHPAPAADSD